MSVLRAGPHICVNIMKELLTRDTPEMSAFMLLTLYPVGCKVESCVSRRSSISSTHEFGREVLEAERRTVSMTEEFEMNRVKVKTQTSILSFIYGTDNRKKREKKSFYVITSCKSFIPSK